MNEHVSGAVRVTGHQVRGARVEGDVDEVGVLLVVTTTGSPSTRSHDAGLLRVTPENVTGIRLVA
jgi:hypothetical protein